MVEVPDSAAVPVVAAGLGLVFRYQPAPDEGGSKAACERQGRKTGGEQKGRTEPPDYNGLRWLAYG